MWKRFSPCLLVCGTWAMILSGCSSFDLGSEDPVSVDVNVDSPTWTNGISQLVTVKCDNCHAIGASRFAPGEIVEEPSRYQWDLGASEESFALHALSSYGRIYERADDPMPPPYGTPLNSAELSALQTFIEETSLADVCRNRQGGAQLTWEADIRPLYVQNCEACHRSADAAGGLEISSLQRWRQLRVTILNTLVTEVDVLKMPPPALVNQDFNAEGGGRQRLIEYLCSSQEVL